MEGRRALIYYCVVVKGDVALVIQGIARNNFEQNLRDFRKLAYTVRLK